MKRILGYSGLILLTLIICFWILTRNNEIPTDEDYVILYQQLIDNLVISENTLNNEKYLAFDLDSFTLIKDSYKMSILSYAYKYNQEIFSGNYNSLAEKGYFINGSLEGGLISSKVIRKNKYGNNIVIEISEYKGPLNLYGSRYRAVFKNGGWNLKKINDFVS